MTTESIAPDSSAVRTALWRALHLVVDPPPHLLEDTIGIELVDPEPGWRDRGDMHPEGTAPFRMAIVARTRWVEDLLVSEGLGQYVLLGAGLDTFAQRHGDRADRVEVFEIDHPGPQAWKRQRLEATGHGVAENLHLVPVDFEAAEDWWDALIESGFDVRRPALVSSSGVSMYLTREANAATLTKLGGLAPGSIVAMTFMVPFDRLEPDDRAGLEVAARGAEASGTPWLSFYSSDEMVAAARAAGFDEAKAVPTVEVVRDRFGDRADNVDMSHGEWILVATARS
jgi:methyltransferase (TIGR00027 family)